MSEFNLDGGTAAPQPHQPASAPKTLTLKIPDVRTLFNLYMPIFKSGGLFIPSDKPMNPGDQVFLMINLPNDPQRYPISGKVSWVTPQHAQGGMKQGVGVSFVENEVNKKAKNKIEDLLAGINREDRNFTI